MQVRTIVTTIAHYSERYDNYKETFISIYGRFQALRKAIVKDKYIKVVQTIGKIYVNSILCLLSLHNPLQLTWDWSTCKYPLLYGALYHTWRGHSNLEDKAYPGKQQENNTIPCRTIWFHARTYIFLNTTTITWLNFNLKYLSFSHSIQLSHISI